MLTASIGVSVFPTDASGARELVEHADAAMYERKRSGGRGVAVYAVEAA